VTDVLAVGFFGKLPAVGDFVRRRVGDGLVAAWDDWLQSAVSASRDALGDGWLELYLTAPMWRFFAPAGVLDDLPVAGVLFPSVDRVGRYFPFTVFARLPERSSGVVVADRCSTWFERVEDLVLAQLEDEGHTVEEIDEALAATAEPLVAALHAVPAHLGTTRFEDPDARLTGCRHLPLGERVDIGPTALAWLGQLIERSEPAAMLWWSSGSATVQPSWLITRGLPTPRAFAAMLSGAWNEWPWEAGEEPCSMQCRDDSIRQAPRIQATSGPKTRTPTRHVPTSGSGRSRMAWVDTRRDGSQVRLRQMRWQGWSREPRFRTSCAPFARRSRR